MILSVNSTNRYGRIILADSYIDPKLAILRLPRTREPNSVVVGAWIFPIL
jgi:hypothetical protein